MNNRNFTNLNINPCKMCMPMGAATAFKGIENSMVLLHGSQGCSTYIRRHMSEHYNEPVDIASSSLSEEGTVYGGEKNLKKGLMNIIKLYNPSVIGVATTCLAETIGEDVDRMVQEFKRENGVGESLIIPVHTPGYGGSQFEGYYAALYGIVKAVCADCKPNGRINIIAGYMSPADIRNIKRMLRCFGIDYVLLPDISETLDSPYSEHYNKIPAGGTVIPDICSMAGAKATIEMGFPVSDAISPGKYLKDRFNVPLYKCSLPIGLRNTLAFLELLSEITGIPVPAELLMEKGWLLDGMIDSHKYNAGGRAVIFGEPGLAAAVTGLCAENGIKPVLICTGADNETFNSVVSGECRDDMPVIMRDTDFETILGTVSGLDANILIGGSDGKVLTEKLGIPLVRVGYPIHDRVGGQRLVYTGYNGTMKLLDDITNTLLSDKNDNYRRRAFEKYFEDTGVSNSCFKPEAASSSDLKADKAAAGLMAFSSASAQTELPRTGFNNADTVDKTMSHPCFSGGACKNARMHIPVAPACNISCNYCNRKYDCANESRPGVTSEIFTPREAKARFIKVRRQLGNLKVVGIAGPGDALADFSRTRESIKLIKSIDPGITFCLSTNGLMLLEYADEIIKLGVSHITITINAVNPVIGALVYREINYAGKKLHGEEAAALLIENQLKGLAYMSSRGVVCKVNIVMIKGVNESHIEEVVKKVKECGAYIANIMPLIPAGGSPFENIQPTGSQELAEMRKSCGKHLRQMYHCRQCRADAIGSLDNDISPEFRKDRTGGPETAPLYKGDSTYNAGAGKASSEISDTDAGKTFTFGVATKGGSQVDCHFGQVKEFHIYRYNGHDVELTEIRSTEKYCRGVEECDDEVSRLEKSLMALEGCDAVLVTRIGYHPLKALENKGIKAIQTLGSIEECIPKAAAVLEENIKQAVPAV